MRTKQKPKSDFLTDSRRSIQRDFQRYRRKEKAPEIEDLPKINAERRISFVGEKSEYFRYRSYIVGKKVRLIRESNGEWKQFLCLGREICGELERTPYSKQKGSYAHYLPYKPFEDSPYRWGCYNYKNYDVQCSYIHL